MSCELTPYDMFQVTIHNMFIVQLSIFHLGSPVIKVS